MIATLAACLTATTAFGQDKAEARKERKADKKEAKMMKARRHHNIMKTEKKEEKMNKKAEKGL